jgi:hypothetical protein
MRSAYMNHLIKLRMRMIMASGLSCIFIFNYQFSERNAFPVINLC